MTQATLRALVWATSGSGLTLTQAAQQAGITTHFAGKLIAEATVELDENPPTGDDLKILARRL